MAQIENEFKSKLLASVLAYILKRNYPESAIANSSTKGSEFFCDVDLKNEQISSHDLAKLESEMQEAIGTGVRFQTSSKTVPGALQWSRDEGNRYLEEMMSGEMADQKDIKFCILNDSYEGLCGHNHKCQSSKMAPEGTYFKLTKVSGAYWLGDSKNKQLTRLTGICFESQAKLQDYFSQQASNQERDHRNIGKRQDLFMFSDLVGAGLPLWLENGTIIWREIENYLTSEEIKKGYSHVKTPNITNIKLYETSGHYPYYKDSMYQPIDIDGDKFMLRPMNCPHHFQIYNQKPRSYRDLPIKIAEFGDNHRYEKSGELSGLIRTRVFTLNDAHIICRPDQAYDQINQTLDFIEEIASSFQLVKNKDYNFRLSLGDESSDKYVQDSKLWREAEKVLKGVLEDRKEEFKSVKNEAAFYGPKIDIQMINVNNKEDTAFTIQYDFVMPQRFSLNYTEKDNQVRQTVVIHRSIIGSMGRFVAFLLEKFDGNLPIWLSPQQLHIISLNDDQKVLTYIAELKQQALDLGIRTSCNLESDSVGKKVKQAITAKIPFTIVVGDKEVASHKFSVRIRPDLQNTGQAEENLTFAEILSGISADIKSKSPLTSLG